MPLPTTITAARTGVDHRADHVLLHVAVNDLVALADLFDLTEYETRYTLADPFTIGDLYDVVATFINGVKALSS